MTRVLIVDDQPRARRSLHALLTARIPETRVLVAQVVQRPAMPRRTPPSQEDAEGIIGFSEE